MGHILEGLGCVVFFLFPPSTPSLLDFDGLNVAGGQKRVREAVEHLSRVNMARAALCCGCVSIFTVTLLFPGAEGWN